MRIAFFSGWPLGLRGTPGTYKFVERMTSYNDVIVFSPVTQRDIVYECSFLPIIPLDNPVSDSGLRRIVPTFQQFAPDVVYIFNSHCWPEQLTYLKSVYPDPKYVLDIKTPLLQRGEKQRDIQRAGNGASEKLDGIVTLSANSVYSWIPDCSLEPFVYPLGLDISMFNGLERREKKTPLKNFVYIGVLHPLRKIDKLIESFALFNDRVSYDVSLELLGSGPDLERLREFVSSHNLDPIVKLRGLVRQEDLPLMLGKYDAGIAWVPSDIYNDSPSLKAIEYMAAGLPVIATDTRAHNNLANQGLSVEICPEEVSAMAESLATLSKNGFARERIESNFCEVSKFDYHHIIRSHIGPYLNRVVWSSEITPMTSNESLKGKAGLSDGPLKEKQGMLEATPGSGGGRKRITIFIQCDSLALGKGGAERVAAEVAGEMSRRGHLVYLGYCSSGPPAYVPHEKVVLVPYSSLENLRHLVCDITPDIYFVFYFNRALIDYYSVIYGTSIPFGMQECTNPKRLCENNWKAPGINRWHAIWEREIIASAAARIRLTMGGYADSFPEYIRHNVRTFPNPTFAQAVLAHPGDESGQRKSIINVNGFKANKNLITLVRAFARVADRYPDWDLKIFGKSAEGNEPHKVEVFDFIKEQQLQDRILISGPTDDVYSHYADSHIHVLASLSEGCPTVVLEAMSMGLPSVGFEDCAGTNELIRHNVNGMLASSGDRVGGLESVLSQLMSSSALRTRLGSQALQDSKAFDAAKIYDQWEQLFLEASEYGGDQGRLLQEQMRINPERAMHARRMRERVVRQPL